MADVTTKIKHWQRVGETMDFREFIEERFIKIN